MRKNWLISAGISLLFVFVVAGIEVITADMQKPFFHSLANFFFSDASPFKILFYLIISLSLAYFLNLFLTLRENLRTLQNEQDKYKLIADYSNDVIWTLNMDGKFTYVSPSVYKLRGYTPEEVMKQSFEEALTSTSARNLFNLLRHFDELMQSNPGKVPSVITEIEQSRKDGSTVWTEASVTTVMDDRGKPSFFIGVTRNIHDRKRKESELKRSEENYRLLAETALDYILVHDIEGIITYVNPSGLEASGYELEELAGKDVSFLVPEKYHTQIAGMNESRKNGDKQQYRYEIEFRKKDGTLVPLEVSSALMFLNRKPVSVLVMARDISERKKIEQTIRESEKRFRSYIEDTPVPIFNINKENKILYVNRACCDYLGIHKDRLVGKNFMEFVSEKDKQDLESRLNQLKKNSKINTESRFSLSGGKELIAIVSGARIEENSYLIYTIDITQRLIAERKAQQTDREIRKLNSGLEKLVTKRTLQLEMANKELEAFSYSVSHDLRAPLRHINAFAKLLAQSVNARNMEKTAHYIEIINESVDKMKDLIDNLLMLSRMGRAELVLHKFAMDQIVKQVIEEMRMETNGREIEWKIEPMGEITADNKLLKQVWFNLISNSVKFTSLQKKAVIEIGKMKKDRKEVFYIRDNGAGFDPEYQDKLFGVFQRLHSESEFEGTGIGLATVKRIIDKHKGEIWAESEPGKGACFYFFIN